MPERLTVTDSELGELLELVAPQAGSDLGWPLAWSSLEGLNRLIPSDTVSFFDLDSTSETVTFDQSLPVDDSDAEGDGVFWSHYWGCEPCSYPDRSGDLRSVTKVSDFYSDTEWHNQAMYCDYFRPVGIEREIMLCLPGGPGKTIRLVLFRGPGPDFTERDRKLLALLRPHLYEAYTDGQRRSRGLPDLTERQWQLMRLVAAGYSNAQIARRLFISEGTVRKHLENIFERLDVTNRIAAIDQAFPTRLA
jgi:DNA-binding CsgD family transcriptional regulator